MSDLAAIARVVAIALACGLALSGTNLLTEEKITFNETAALRAAIAELLPAAAAVPAEPPALTRAPGAWQLCDGHLLGRSDAPGYGGDIRLLYTLRTPADRAPGDPAAHRLVRLTVLGHQETPGIADFLAEPDWLAGYADASASEVEGLSAITGATITSRAVRDHLAAMLREPTGLLGQPVPMDCDR